MGIANRGLEMRALFFNNCFMHLLLLSICIITVAPAANKPPVIKNWNDSTIKTKVEAICDNIFQERINNQEVLKETPKKCLATAVADLEHKTIWQPKWHYSGTGTIRLPDAKISPDRSVLTIIENIGKPGAPSSSRIVMINCYNFEILRVIELPEQLLTTLCYIPDTNQLIVAIDRQQRLKQSSGFMIIDLTGRNLPRKIKTAGKIRAITCSNKNLFTVTADNKLVMFNLASPAEPPVKIAADKNITALIFDSATNRLLTAGNRQLNYLKISTMAPDIYAETELPAGFAPNKIILTDSKGDCILIEEDRRFIFARNRQTRAFSKAPGTAADVALTKQLLAISIRHKQLLQLYQLPTSTELKPCEPRKIKPKTRGDIIMLAFLPEPPTEIKPAPSIKEATKTKKVKKTTRKKEKKPSIKLIIIGSHGNIYTLEYYKRRWRKALIIKPKK
jgi:hypothetical protein